MRIHQVNQNRVWQGVSRDSEGVPPGWVACEIEPTPGSFFNGESWGQIFGDPELIRTDLQTAEQADRARLQRNTLLAETDWRFRSDMIPSQEWKDYCQALRDVPNQEGFPWNVIWPTKPE